MNKDTDNTRWKIQIVFEMLTDAKTGLENGRIFFESNTQRILHEIDSIRNSWFAIIGLIIAISIPTIITLDLGIIYYVIPIGFGFGAFLTFFMSNIFLDRIHTQINEFQKKYYAYENELMHIKATIQRHTLMNDLKDENVMILYSCVELYGITINYQLSKFLQEKLLKKQFDNSKFLEEYKMAKMVIDDIKKREYVVGIKSIEQFIEDFERDNSK